MELCILGANGAVPMPDRFPSCQVLRDGGINFMIDCGEGSQNRFGLCQVKRSRINHIFISHLHGDHVFGLPGLLSSYNLFGRQADLHLYGPKGIKAFIRTFLIHTHLNLQYPLHLHEHETRESTVILEHQDWTISTIPLIHRIPTTGYLFRYKSHRYRIRPQALVDYDLSIQDRKKLVAGEDILDQNNEPISNSQLTIPPTQKSYAYCSDTRYFERLSSMVQGVDLLYHESTFTEADGKLAYERYHSTASDAAKIAAKADVGQLLLGHFSARYTNLSAFITEAQNYFDVVALAREGKIFKF